MLIKLLPPPVTSPLTADVTDVIESPPRKRLGATGEEMEPTDPLPAPVAANNPLPAPLEPPVMTHFNRYFWMKFSGTSLNWELKSKVESEDWNVGTTLIKNLSAFFESEDIVTSRRKVVEIEDKWQLILLLPAS